jgi:hypothetical protein
MNRLGKNMPLMTDPAVIYGLELEGQWRGTLGKSDLATIRLTTRICTAGCRRVRWRTRGSVAAGRHAARADGLLLFCGRGNRCTGTVAVFEHAG